MNPGGYHAVVVNDVSSCNRNENDRYRFRDGVSIIDSQIIHGYFSETGD